jgi:hypothetical protein
VAERKHARLCEMKTDILLKKIAPDPRFKALPGKVKLPVD